MSNHLGHALPWNALNSALQFEAHNLQPELQRLLPLDEAAVKSVRHFARTLAQQITDFEKTDRRVVQALNKQQEQAVERELQAQAKAEAEAANEDEGEAAERAERLLWQRYQMEAIDSAMFDEQHGASEREAHACYRYSAEKLRPLLDENRGGQGCPGGVLWSTYRALLVYVSLNLALLQPSKWRRFFNPRRGNYFNCPFACAMGEHDGALPPIFATQFLKLYSREAEQHDPQDAAALGWAIDESHPPLLLRRFDAAATSDAAALNQRIFRRLILHNRIIRTFGSAEQQRLYLLTEEKIVEEIAWKFGAGKFFY